MNIYFSVILCVLHRTYLRSSVTQVHLALIHYGGLYLPFRSVVLAGWRQHLLAFVIPATNKCRVVTPDFSRSFDLAG